MKDWSDKLYLGIVLLGLLPTLAVFIWGVHTSLQRTSEPLVTPFSQMK